MLFVEAITLERVRFLLRDKFEVEGRIVEGGWIGSDGVVVCSPGGLINSFCPGCEDGGVAPFAAILLPKKLESNVCLPEYSSQLIAAMRGGAVSFVGHNMSRRQTVLPDSSMISS